MRGKRLREINRATGAQMDSTLKQTGAAQNRSYFLPTETLRRVGFDTQLRLL